VRIAVGNVWSEVYDAQPREERQLDDYLSCEHVTYRGGPGGRTRHVERYRMYRPDRRFPTGFISLLASAGFEVEFVNAGGLSPPATDGTADLDWLRDYQKKAVWAAANRGRGIIKVPTGGGKTEIFVGLTRVLPVEWLFLVHRADLVTQTADRYRLRTGEKAGVFNGGVWQRGTANVTVSTFQAIYWAWKNKMPGVQELFDGIEAINVDEVHAQPADTFYNMSMLFENARYRIGQSGTPLDRSEIDSMRTIGCLGPIVYEIKKEVLVEAGVLSESSIHMPPVDQDGHTKASWRTVYNDLIVHSKVRNEAVAKMVEQADKPCLCFVDEYAHGANLQKELQKLGLRVGFVHGGHSLDMRQSKIKRLVQDQVDVLLCTVIFQEGIDIPQLRSVVNAAGKASVVAALQRIGRGMRITAGKTSFQVWDVWDTGQKWIQDHAKERYRAYRDAGHDVKVTWPDEA